MKIFRELYDTQNVKLILNDKILEDGFKSISSDIALIPQEPEIFNTTIKENITLGISKSPDELKRYAKLTGFNSVVNKLPKKFNSYIYEKGVNLSGGEKQRLALARGLMASEDKAIILLDESTSSVDLQNEMKIYENIFKNYSNKTIIASIHRLHLLSFFDKVYFFKNGKIIESGTFEELKKNSNEFRRIWAKYKRMQEK